VAVTNIAGCKQRIKEMMERRSEKEKKEQVERGETEAETDMQSATSEYQEGCVHSLMMTPHYETPEVIVYTLPVADKRGGVRRCSLEEEILF